MAQKFSNIHDIVIEGYSNDDLGSFCALQPPGPVLD